MNTELDIIVAGLIGFVIGAVLLAIIKRGSSANNEALEAANKQLAAEQEKTKALQAQYDAYREEVSAHFAKTADAVDSLTQSYQHVFAHLSDGAQHLMNKETLQTQLKQRQGKAITLAYLVDKEEAEAVQELNKDKSKDAVDQANNDKTTTQSSSSASTDAAKATATATNTSTSKTADATKAAVKSTDAATTSANKATASATSDAKTADATKTAAKSTDAATTNASKATASVTSDAKTADATKTAAKPTDVAATNASKATASAASDAKTVDATKTAAKPTDVAATNISKATASVTSDAKTADATKTAAKVDAPASETLVDMPVDTLNPVPEKSEVNKPVIATKETGVAAVKGAEERKITPQIAEQIVKNDEHETALDAVKKHIKDDKGSKQ